MSLGWGLTLRHLCRLVLLLAFLPLAAFAAPVPPVGPGDMVLGPAAAPVTIVEYGSLTCPHCAAFDQEIFPEIKRQWIDTGKIRFVFRDMPRDQLDLKAFQLAHCSGDPRFWGFLDALFRNQRSWMSAADPTAQLVQIGRLGGLSEAAAHACLSNDALARASVASAKGGHDAGVTATPSFFANGEAITPFSLDDWAKALTEAGAK